jgi:tetratricopeptide (TPR) repeat protein
MSLAEVLLSNGQLQAAENELRRILERDPNYVPALLRIGEVISAHGRWWAWDSPLTYWKRALEIEPNNRAARQLVADYYQDQAESELYWNNYDAAIEAYERALTYQPGSGPLLATLGGCYLRMGEEEKAQAHFEEALTKAPGELVVYDRIIQAWIDVGEPERAWEITQQAEAAVEEVPYEFYFAQAYYCCMGSHEAFAQPWLDRAIELAPPDMPIFVLIGEMAISTESWALAREYLDRAIAEDQVLGHSHLLLGVVASQEGDPGAARRHWREAERIARQEDDTELLERVRMTRLYFSGPPGLGSLLMRMGYDLGDIDLDEDDDFFDEYGDDEYDF